VLLRFATAGSVDDGKSTLIGRLLHDRNLLLDDQLEALRALTSDQSIDLALITDGLRAEREQKITIDVAYRYFQTEKRKFILADTPGHEQYTRNMITGVSTADLVVLLVDARKGLTAQTRRHTLICSLLGVPQLVLAVNKMDTVDYQESVFEKICQEFLEHCGRLEVRNLRCIPMSALRGDNVVDVSTNMPWYDGPTLMQYLHRVHVGGNSNVLDFRFSVQCVIRPDQDFRGLAGRVCSGRVQRGQSVVVLPSGLVSRIRSIYAAGGIEKDEALAGDSLTITLEDEIEAGRGAIVARQANQPEVATTVDVTLCWMSENPLRTGVTYWMLHCSRRLRCQVERVHYQIDVATMHQRPADSLTLNQIGRVRIRATEPVAFDPYAKNRILGSFVLVDVGDHQTVAAGMIRGRAAAEEARVEVFYQAGSVPKAERQQRAGHRACVVWLTGLPASGKSTLARALDRILFDRGCSTFYLDGDNLRHGLNRDLGFGSADRRENIRRAAEVAHLAYLHGNVVLCSFISPFSQEREMARSLIPEGDFFEVFVSCSVEECRRRDPKGLYARALEGYISEFTGVSSPYEEPARPDLTVSTEAVSVSEACEQIMALLEERQVLGGGGESS